MDNSCNNKAIKECLKLVESRFNRGGRQQWTNYDFQKLSDDLLESTGVILSITTLKRIFGKVKYEHAPSTSTLNALAKYAGFNDWGELRMKVPVAAGQIKEPEEIQLASKSSSLKRWYWWAGGIITTLLLLFFLTGSATHEKTAAQESSAYQFSSNKVLTSGIPNSVIFSYDATAAGRDSVFIAQDWDIQRKKWVSAREHTFSSIYYFPGFFRAKLIVGDKIMQQHDIFITSKGWLAAVEQLKNPLYFNKAEVLKDSILAITPSLLKAHNIDLQPHGPSVRFYNVREMPGFTTNNFTFETTLKNDFKEGDGACQFIQVMILCKNDVIIVPLSAKGCVGNLHLYAAGVELSSVDNDLSGFGCDPSQWVNLKVESVNHQIRFMVDGKLAASLKLLSPPSDIVGVQYRFTGPSAIKKAVFYKDTEVVKLL